LSSKFSVNQPDDFDMSHQFPSSVPGRSVGRPFHGRPSSTHIASSDDWTTHQSLFLGSNTVPYRWQVSLSPQESSPHTAGSFIVPSPQAQSNEVPSPFQVESCTHCLPTNVATQAIIMILSGTPTVSAHKQLVLPVVILLRLYLRVPHLLLRTLLLLIR